MKTIDSIPTDPPTGPHLQDEHFGWSDTRYQDTRPANTYRPTSVPISRRELLIGGSVVGAALIAWRTGLFNDSSSSTNYGSIDGSTVPTSPLETYPSNEFPAIFTDNRSEKITDELAINPGTYYVVTKEALKKCSTADHLHDQGILPIFMPGVSRYHAELKASAAANNVPINMLAILTSMESAGRADAHSEDDAWGPMQIVPEYWLQAFISKGYLPNDASLQDYQLAMNTRPQPQNSKYSKEVYEQAFTDPAKNIMIGGSIVADAIRQVRATGNYDSTDLGLYIRAAGVYNDGPDAVASNYSDLPVQTQLYMDHFVRMTLDVNIAGELRKQGVPDNEILRAMQSGEMNARALAYAETAQYRNNTNYTTYLICNQLCAQPEPGGTPSNVQSSNALGQTIASVYSNYQHGTAKVPNSTTGKYTIPAPPGLRIWMASGGSDLLGELDINVDWQLP